jgi:hypothetical protein
MIPVRINIPKSAGIANNHPIPAAIRKRKDVTTIRLVKSIANT